MHPFVRIGLFLSKKSFPPRLWLDFWKRLSENETLISESSLGFGSESETGVLRVFVFFQDRPMFRHLSGKAFADTFWNMYGTSILRIKPCIGKVLIASIFLNLGRLKNGRRYDKISLIKFIDRLKI